MSSTTPEFLWYIPNQAFAGHRGDEPVADHNSLDTLATHAKALEDHGWQGALIGTGWGRPDTFTPGTALAARTDRFNPLIAIRPGYWQPAQFASAAASRDHMGTGRIRINTTNMRETAGLNRIPKIRRQSPDPIPAPQGLPPA